MKQLERYWRSLYHLFSPFSSVGTEKGRESPFVSKKVVMYITIEIHKVSTRNIPILSTEDQY